LSKPTYETREQWLRSAVEALKPDFRSAGYTVPNKLRASCGWPATGGTRSKNKTIGMCHQADNSADGHYEIFIHPGLDQPIEVLETLVHEIGHAVLPSGTGHKKPFARLCVAIGLDGKPTATHASDNLRNRLQEVADNLGKYPHGALSAGGETQGTRLLAVRCTQCECVVRMTAKWLDEVGAPTCGCGAPMQEQAQMDPDTIKLKTVEQMIMYTSPDDRFGIMFTKDRRKGQQWILVDYEMDNRTTYCDDRQDCLDTITAIREGMHVYEDAPVEAEDYEVDEFELNHDWAFEALMPEHHLPGWDHEDHDVPEDNGPATPFDYEAAKGIAVPEWDSTRDKYIENEQPEIVPATRPEPQPETVKTFGPEALRA
jgi:hypothetical protein